MNHSLSNMLTTIKNGQMSKKTSIFIKKTKFCEVVLQSLWDEGFISGYSSFAESSDKLQVYLKYDKIGMPVIKNLLLVSKPGRRVFLSSKQTWKLNSSHLFVIFSTNKGILSLSECKKLNVGGEPLFLIK